MAKCSAPPVLAGGYIQQPHPRRKEPPCGYASGGSRTGIYEKLRRKGIFRARAAQAQGIEHHGNRRHGHGRSAQHGDMPGPPKSSSTPAAMGIRRTL